MLPVSVVQLVKLSLVFFARNIGTLLWRVWAPSLASCVALYFAFQIYLERLQQMLRAPSQAEASILLGFFSAATLLLLLLYTVMSVAVCQLVLTDGKAKARIFRLGYFEWRLYAAVVRLLLLAVLFCLVMGAIQMGVQMVAPGGGLPILIRLVWGAILAALIVRAGFLVPAIAMAEARGVVIRRAWSLSAGSFWNLALTIVALLVPGTVLELIGEYLARSFGLISAPHGTDLIERQADLLLNVLPYFVIIFSLTAALTVILLSIASCLAYRKLQDGPAALA